MEYVEDMDITYNNLEKYMEFFDFTVCKMNGNYIGYCYGAFGATTGPSIEVTGESIVDVLNKLDEEASKRHIN